ncbi:MAG: efflux RND transporter permease subunit, partial [Muribaculaceae bacterium]|nr:efflux RND transporter permease subunit [Muribaculaceae bacterium]
HPRRPTNLPPLPGARPRQPLAVNADAPGNEIQAPLAIVILGGLASSTVLNAYVVPVIYSYFKPKNKKEHEA